LLVLFVLFFFICEGAAAGFPGWIYSYAVTLGLGDQTSAAYLTSAYWGAFTLARLLAIPISTRVRPRYILLADLLGGLLSLGVILGWPQSPAATWLAAIGLGLSMASLFPTTILLAGRRMTITGQVTGWFFVGASLGNMFFPMLFGQLFDSVGPPAIMTAMTVELVLAVGVLAILIRFASPAGLARPAPGHAHPA
jgi:fucose permease